MCGIPGQNGEQSARQLEAEQRRNATNSMSTYQSATQTLKLLISRFFKERKSGSLETLKIYITTKTHSLLKNMN